MNTATWIVNTASVFTAATGSADDICAEISYASSLIATLTFSAGDP